MIFFNPSSVYPRHIARGRLVVTKYVEGDLWLVDFDRQEQRVQIGHGETVCILNMPPVTENLLGLDPGPQNARFFWQHKPETRLPRRTFFPGYFLFPKHAHFSQRKKYPLEEIFCEEGVVLERAANDF